MIAKALAAITLLGATPAAAQALSAPTTQIPVKAPEATKDVVYLQASGKDLHLDVYRNTAFKGPRPVLVYIHGGAWWKGEKPAGWGGFRAYLAAGFSVVTVEYRLTDVAPAPAPAAVQDVRCALSWVKANARTYGFDAKRVVPYGTSAGGHLALMAGMLPKTNDIDLPACRDQPTVPAILDFYGPYHLRSDLPGAFRSPSTARWIGDGPPALWTTMSPATYVRKGQPPVFIVHGDADPTVPYETSLALKADLDKAGVQNRFHTVPGGVHGKFPKEEQDKIEREALEFLTLNKVVGAR
ncbi:alpha/beta hydrolase [Caulobacter sp. BE254]|uniref:alpha/beta hydrolase n=1 Tax=Caulobacter sp. BE254 TaxID=2817720 RepID=UPI00285802D0|nr:alpha/beta hydrolase [Caulobacter sp. BE254]MDR7115537.1 acetyl esterase/lipase [Caulobacter sp. BE254]